MVLPGRIHSRRIGIPREEGKKVFYALYQQKPKQNRIKGFRVAHEKSKCITHLTSIAN
jgi:hypothetical protein